ncbi:ABC transporter ATP-binding protein [Rhizobium sp. KVB221]|uniref:ABC transporter ATP-binding protein n=1 Tax=Rhizobium setariae TaxID=2801340 RepID=A0A936YR13_9HYPH|nr:ABC transporter ATP-binding protein [Rhizobium setariae]MBL0375224.1 ABC transporter ATP-binding protein [Rhizobium setariae]
MASIDLINLTKTFGPATAVNDLTLNVRDNEFVALLGPSGCGKSTTMNMIAGIEHPTSGEIRFDGRDISGLPANKRGIGFVFQNYAIFTHLSVRENLAFALRVRGVPRQEINRRVADIAALMRLSDKLDRPSARLSVNEMQKLAIGRSAIAEPAIFLLDEPLSNVDAAFRAFMRTELKHLQHALKQTMVYVTHDQIEAMSLADRIAVMSNGVLQQFGTPEEVYNAPANTFVANFMGSPSMNLITAVVTEESGRTAMSFKNACNLALTADGPLATRLLSSKSREVTFGIRPEDVELADTSDPRPGLTLPATFVEPIGPRTTIHLGEGEVRMKVITEKRFRTGLGQALKIIMPEPKCHLFDTKSGAALRMEARHVNA